MGKLDDLRKLRETDAKHASRPPPSRQPKPIKATNGVHVDKDGTVHSADRKRIHDLEAEIGAAFAALKLPAIPNVTLAEAITMALKSVPVGSTKGGGKHVASTKPTECLQCAKRRKAKAKSMQRYRAKIAKTSRKVSPRPKAAAKKNSKK